MNDDQAGSAVDPFENTLSLIGNSRETDPPEEGEDDDKDTEASDEVQEGTEDEEADEGAAEDPPSEPAKVKIKTRDDDGNEVESEVTHDELVGGYLRQADYTRKTQALAERERQAVDAVTAELNQGREQYGRALQQAQAVIHTVGGLKSAQEMAQLAQTDPGRWVQEQARQDMLRQVLGGIEQEAATLQRQADEQQRQADEQQQQAHAKALRASWKELDERGIKEADLRALYGDAAKSYPFMSAADLESITDWRAVLLLKDAVQFRKLKESNPAVKAKVAQAAKVPQQRQAEAAQSRVSNAARKQVFQKGGAQIRDLASFIKTIRK